MRMQLASGLLKYFPAPKLLAMPAVGIEITPEAIRFIELTQTTSGYKIGRFGNIPIVGESIDEDVFPSGDGLKKLLSEVREKNKLSLVSVALPEEKTYIFRAEAPALSPDEIRQSIELKLEEFVPIPPRETVFDYEVIDKTAERLRINVSAIPHHLVTRYLEFFESAALSPVSFQVSAQAVVNAVVSRGDDAPAIVINLGAEKSGLYLVSHRTVHFTSTVGIGSATLTEAVKKYFAVTSEEAEKIKEERGLSGGKKNSELFLSVVSSLSVLRDEVEKLAAYWESHIERYSDQKLKIERIILCGRDAGLDGLPEYFESGLGLRTELANVWVNVFSFDSYIPPIPRKESLSYASVIGLSLS